MVLYPTDCKNRLYNTLSSSFFFTFMKLILHAWLFRFKLAGALLCIYSLPADLKITCDVVCTYRCLELENFVDNFFFHLAILYFCTIHEVFRKLTHRLFRRNFGYTLRAVNDLYIEKYFDIREDFQKNLKNYYFAEAQIGDFEDKAFLSKINQRIHKLTKGLIKEALSNLSPDLLLLLVNCIYFKGTWENKFPAEYTHNANFRVSDKEVVKVPMMKTKGNFFVAVDSDLDCDVLQLPYVGNISMLIAMPHKLSGIKLLEKKLNSHVVEKWQKIMTNRTRDIYLPRFKLEKIYNLKDVLSNMGVKDVFTAKADFSGITNEDINIGLFQQQGSITVNEEGTQAASLTTVGFTPLSTQTRFIVDRPFLFFIYEHRTNCLIFCGRVSNPTKS